MVSTVEGSVMKEKLERSGLLNHGSASGFQATVWRKDWCPCIPARFVIVLWCFLGLFCTYALKSTLPIAILAMVKEGDSYNHETSTKVFNWNAAEQGLILSANHYGFPWLRIPGGLLADRFGAKYMAGTGVLVSSIIALLIPKIASFSIYSMIVLQVIAGLFEGLVLPSIHAIIGKWAPPSERTRIVAFIISGENFGSGFAYIFSAVIIVYGGGWPNVFYIFGSIGVMWFGTWLFVMFDSPAKHPRISSKERNYVQSSIDDPRTTSILSVPWMQVLLSGPVWAITITVFSSMYGYTLIQATLPTYYRQVIGFDLKEGLIVNGVFSAIPFAVKFPCALIVGPVADYLIANYCSTTVTRKIFCFLSFCICAFFLVLCGFFGGYSKWTALVFVTLAVGANGLEVAGIAGNHIDIASNYAGFLFGLTHSLGSIAGIISPQIAKAIANLDASAPHEVLVRQWRNVFLVAAEIYVFGAIAYVIMGSGDKQPWANGNHKNLNSEEMELKSHD